MKANNPAGPANESPISLSFKLDTPLTEKRITNATNTITVRADAIEMITVGTGDVFSLIKIKPSKNKDLQIPLIANFSHYRYL
jgi:hypothetical protein